MGIHGSDICDINTTYSTVGHGRSEGDRVHVETFHTYVLDVIQHVERMKREHSDIPCFLMGHSMVSARQYMIRP